MSRSLDDRFWPKVAIGAPDQCWPWTGGHDSHGYGHIKVNGHQIGTHRMAWFLTRGPVALGRHVLHSCDNRPCCNPAHLWLGSHADNMRDMVAKGRNGPALEALRLARGHSRGWAFHPDNRGSRNGQARLTEQQVLTIRALSATGLSRQEVAMRFGVAANTVSNVVNRRYWKHV